MNVKCISDNLLCAGCGACNAICTRGAISMKRTATMGLLYACVDDIKCIDCGLCLKVCPSVNILERKSEVAKEDIVGDIKSCYVGRSLNPDIFKNAQSGGLVTQILSYLFDENLIDAVISCRMIFGRGVPNVSYNILTSKEELHLNQKSCYTQVDVVSALKETNSYRSVAIVGLPCQIQGVAKLSELKKCKNITYKIGLVCDKTYSNTYMNAIMNNSYQKEDVLIKYRQKDFTFRDVYYSYQKAPTVICGKEGVLSIIPNRKRMFLKEFFTVPKCRLCADKLNVYADIVLGDPWGMKDKYDQNQGDSLILVRTEKGISILNELVKDSLVSVVRADVEEVVRGQFIKERVNDIHLLDWNEKKRIWMRHEGMSKSQIVQLVNKKYKKGLFKSFMGDLLIRIKKIFK